MGNPCCRPCCKPCCNPCCDNGLNDIAKGVNCIIGGLGKGICCGISVLNNMGNSLLCPPPRPCCRPKPHPPSCTCTCTCKCCCK